MKRVFLDQLHWITLARVQTGTESRRAVVETFDLVRYAASHGLASFPLDAARYDETLKRADPRSRQELGRFMYSISHGHTIASIVDLLEVEAEIALSKYYDLPTPSTPRVFGVGLRHAFGVADRSYFSNADTERNAIAAFGAERVAELFESALISGPAERLPAYGAARPDDWWGREQVEDEKALRDRISGHGHTPDLARRAVMAEEAIHALDAINKVAAARSLPAVRPRSREDIESLVRAMPSKDLLTRMRMTAHANERFKWEVGGLNDLTSLAVAGAYCEVVVTERKWGDVLNRQRPKPPARVITRLDELPELLVSPSSTY